MIERKSLLDLNFYKKTCFTGSYKGIRYRIKLEKGEEQTTLQTTVWPEPYGYDATDENLKERADFPFTEEGLEQIAVWLTEKQKEKHTIFTN